MRAALLVLLAAALAAGLLGTGVLLFAPGTAVAAPAGVLVQYGYRLDVPTGWAHTGGLPERRRVLLTPAATPEGSDLIAVERSPLGYDADAERPRALAELRAEFDAAVAGGSACPASGRGRTPVARSCATSSSTPTVAPVDWFVHAGRRCPVQRGLPAQPGRCRRGAGGLRARGRFGAPAS